MKWQALLPKLSDLRIPRYMSCSSNVKSLQLHMFVDASLDAYAAVAYLQIDLGDEIRCSLLASKTRVAPLKPISVPRMELMAAVLGLRLAKCLVSELSKEIEKRVFWTDAQDVLFWIRSDARKYPQFVALRVEEILEGSEVGEWRWVSSQLNVADDGTKWTKGVEVNSSIRWFSGPNYLLQDESKWPLGNEMSKTRESQVLHHKEEIKKPISPLACVMPDPLRFSKLERLRAAQKRVLDFLRLLSVKPHGPELERMLLLKRDVEMGTIFIRTCQEEEFLMKFDA